jgi:predicted secreted protein
VPTGKDIAAAVNGHLKARRILGQKDTTIAAVARSLGITDDEVKTAFADFHIAGAKVSKNSQQSITISWTKFSPTIVLKK